MLYRLVLKGENRSRSTGSGECSSLEKLWTCVERPNRGVDAGTRPRVIKRVDYLHGDRDVDRGHVPPQRRCRFRPVPPFPPLLRPPSTPLLLGGGLRLSRGSVGVIELAPRVGGLGRGGRRGARGDGGVRRRAVLLSMLEPERVASGRRGGRGLRRLGHGALRRVLGQLGQRHVVQLRGGVGSLERIRVEDGLPLFGSFIDGELSKLRNGSSRQDFGPRSSAGLRRRALGVV